MKDVIEMGDVTYEIQRIFNGTQSATSLLQRRILRENRKMTPLTQQPFAPYTASSSVVSQKEV